MIRMLVGMRVCHLSWGLARGPVVCWPFCSVVSAFAFLGRGLNWLRTPSFLGTMTVRHMATWAGGGALRVEDEIFNTIAAMNSDLATNDQQIAEITRLQAVCVRVMCVRVCVCACVCVCVCVRVHVRGVGGWV